MKLVKTEKIKQALRFAAYHFKLNGILRKYHGTPYIQHPIAVAILVQLYGGDENQVIASILHDSVEDCPKTVKLEMIREMFGDDVATLVDGLTDISKPEDGNRARRKKIDREHSALGCARTQTIKLADVIHNTDDIVENDPGGFAIIYLKEKELLLKVLTKGDRRLHAIASEQLINCKAKLGIV